MIAFPTGLLALNRKSADSLPLRDTIVELHDGSVEIHVRVTWEKDDAQRYVDEAHQLDVATMIAGGGDGIINEASTALIQSQGGNIPALGILPLETANDFATNAGIPDDLDKTLELAITANAAVIDMMQINDKTCSISMATGGFGTCITTEMLEKLKATLGGTSYLIHGLMHMDTLKSDACDIRGRDFHWQGKALVVGIGGSRQTSGGQQLCPTTLISGGLLQPRIFTGEELLPGLLSALTQFEDDPNTIKDASSWFDIRAPHEITFNLDGEPLSGQEFHIEVLLATLHCRLPPGCPLLH